MKRYVPHMNRSWADRLMFHKCFNFSFWIASKQVVDDFNILVMKGSSENQSNRILAVEWTSPAQITNFFNSRSINIKKLLNNFNKSN